MISKIIKFLCNGIAFASLLGGIPVTTIYAQEEEPVEEFPAAPPKTESLSEMGASNEAGDPGPIFLEEEPIDTNLLTMIESEEVAAEVLANQTSTVGDIVVMDGGLLLTEFNPNDFPLSEGLFGIRFTPINGGADGYVVEKFTPSLMELTENSVPGVADDSSTNLPLEFPFPFFGDNFDSVWVNSNGNITMSRDATRVELPLPQGREDQFGPTAFLDEEARIAIYYADLNPTSSDCSSSTPCSFTYQSTPDTFIVTWTDVPRLIRPDLRFTGQVRLYPDGRIELVYQRWDQDVATRTFNGGMGITAGALVPDHTGPMVGDLPEPIYKVDFSSLTGPLTLSGARTIMEFFTTDTLDDLNFHEGDHIVDVVGTMRALNRNLPPKFDYAYIFTDPFSVQAGDGVSSRRSFQNFRIKNRTLGISLDPAFDSSFLFGNPDYGNPASPNMESFAFMHNLAFAPHTEALLAQYNHPVLLNSGDLAVNISPPDWEPSRLRLTGVLGQWVGQDPGTGTGLPGRFATLTLRTHPIGTMAHEFEHRWGFFLRYQIPGQPQSNDLERLSGQHISLWVDTTTTKPIQTATGKTLPPPSLFGGPPRFSVFQGGAIQDVEDPGDMQCPGSKTLFRFDPDAVADGWSALEQYILGVRRADFIGPSLVDEVGPISYVKNPTYALDDCLHMTGGPCEIPITDVTINRPSRHSTIPDNTVDASHMNQFALPGVKFCGERVTLTAFNLQFPRRNFTNNALFRNTTGLRGFVMDNAYININDARRACPQAIARTGCASPTPSNPQLCTPLCPIGDEIDYLHDTEGNLVFDAMNRPIPKPDVKNIAMILIMAPNSDLKTKRMATNKMNLIREVFEDYINVHALNGLKADGTYNPNSLKKVNTSLGTLIY